MSVLYFHNPGEIDIRGATVAGLSVKSDESTAIGFFGTGLKYSISCILRWGGSIIIHSGLDSFHFSSKDLSFRDKNFKQVCMSGTELGFTTEYGKTWEPWQVFRELYANALDEGGNVSCNRTEPIEGCTVIEVSCPELFAEFDDRDAIILPSGRHWRHQGSEVQIDDQPSSHIYYRGVRVKPTLSALTYNILSKMDLTEDRTLSSSSPARYKCEVELGKLTDETMIYRALTTGDLFFEHLFDFPSWRSYTPEFIAVACRVYRANPQKNTRLKELIEHNKPEMAEPRPVALSEVRTKMLERAKDLVGRMGMNPYNYQIIVAELGENNLGQYNKATNKIFLDPKCFDKGTKEVVCTLYEELTHATTGHDDCCYPMQTHLFEKIISLYEEFLFQEPI